MFLLDSDSIEVEGLPSDKLNQRGMQLGSMALLCALNRAKGLPPPERPRGPPLKFAPLPRALVEKYTRPPEIRTPAGPVSIPGEGKGRAVIRCVAEAYEITPGDLLGNSRSRHVVCGRMVASRLLRDLTWEDGTSRFSLPQIGRMLHRDHSTVCYYLQTFDAYSRKYPFMREAFDALREAA